MSTPVSFCWLSKAALGDEQAFAGLVEAMDYNLRLGHFSVMPCRHTPPCAVPSDEQKQVFEDRLNAAIRERRAKAKPAAPVSFDRPVPPPVQHAPVERIEDVLRPYPDEPHPDDEHAWKAWWVKKGFKPDDVLTEGAVRWIHQCWIETKARWHTSDRAKQEKKA